jgi:hypothetical protein
MFGLEFLIMCFIFKDRKDIKSPEAEIKNVLPPSITLLILDLGI